MHPPAPDSIVEDRPAPATGERRQRLWASDSQAVQRFVADLIAAEAGRLRPAAAAPRADQFLPETKLNEDGLGFDSLERLQLAAALSECLHLHRSGIEDYLLIRPVFSAWCDIAAQSLRTYSATITVRTAGSTGTPKSCSHPLAQLEQEVDSLALLLSGTTRVLSAVPSHHIYGFLFSILLPQRLGGMPVIDIRGQSPGAIRALVRPGDLVVGHPAFWTAVARASPRGWLPAVTGLTSTAPCPAELAAALQSAGLTRLLQIHGSSETGGIGWRDDPDNPYTLLPHWQRASGTHLLRLPLPDSADPPVSVMAPDVIAWIDQRRYHLLGRRDGAVQVGGINVFPDRIRDVLRQHPGVSDASVRLMTALEGQRLKAFIVPANPAEPIADLQAGIELWITQHLSAVERPRALTFGAALPLGPMGKAADWPIIKSDI